MGDRRGEGGRDLGRKGTREEVKCNRGFIVCGSLGREKAAERGEETRGEGGEAMGTERQAATLRRRTDRKLEPFKRCCSKGGG